MKCFETSARCRRSSSGLKAADDHAGEAVQPLCFSWCDVQRGAAPAGRQPGPKHLLAEDPYRHSEGWSKPSLVLNDHHHSADVLVCLSPGLRSSHQPQTAGFGRKTQLPHLWRPQVCWHWEHSQTSVRRRIVPDFILVPYCECPCGARPWSGEGSERCREAARPWLFADSTDELAGVPGLWWLHKSSGRLQADCLFFKSINKFLVYQSCLLSTAADGRGTVRLCDGVYLQF